MSDVELEVTGFTVAEEAKKGFSMKILSALEDSARRDIDAIGALSLLILVLPVMLILACLIMKDGGRVMFSHRRIGRGGIPFDCYKFRTMVLNAEECLHEYLRQHPEALLEWERDHKLTVDPRITPLGAVLRRTSLDEIPQLINVLAGHMSLVGPRPVTDREMRERYGTYAAVVTSVRPGITGLWQVSGRNDIDYETRVLMDAQYVRQRTLLTDILILLRTVPAVLKCTGAR